MNVKTSSFAPIVTFVTTGEFKADKTTVYGLTPSLIVSPHGSHVTREVTFGCTEATGVDGAGGKHEVSDPAGAKIVCRRQVPSSELEVCVRVML